MKRNKFGDIKSAYEPARLPKQKYTKGVNKFGERKSPYEPEPLYWPKPMGTSSD